MEVHYGIEQFKGVAYPVVTTGIFDGVHLGHRKIIDRLKEVAGKSGGETVILTFYPHPRVVLFPEQDLKLLNTQEEKIELLEKSGIHHLIAHPFTKEFSRLTSEEFIKTVLAGIGTKKLVIGYDHHFGKNREGSFEHLKEFGPTYGFEVEEIPARDVDSVEVSSTKIRKALLEADVQTASKYLGYTYFLTGKVVKGRQLGKTLGYPTANIEVSDKHKLVPGDGIYAVTVDHDGKNYKGMLSIGMNPTVNGTKRTIEVNIFDFSKEIYGDTLRIYFFEKLRNEVKFDSLEALKERLFLDKQEAMNILGVN